MEDKESTSPIRKKLIAGAVAIGTVFGAAGVASAVTSQGDTSSTDPTVQSDDEADEIDDEANEGAETDDDDGDHGRMGDETPLTGSVAEQVTAAALAAVPGGTIDRVETDANGAVYEAHMTDADGNPVTVTFDENIDVVETITGQQRKGGHRDGEGGRGHHDETPLSGAVADEVTAATEAAVPGGTVTKVEQEGTGYEAHVTDADGNEVEVYFDQDMNVLETEQGR